MSETDPNDVIVEGAWDTHVHAGPDATPRKADVVEVARAASAKGMGGLVLKNHFFPTAAVAAVAETWLDADITLAGTVVLNRSVGGLNPDAVEAAHRFGARRMELPTMTAKHNMVEQQEPKTIALLENGTLTGACRDVLDAAIEREMVVGTGHVSVEEVEHVVEYVTANGGRVLVTHPELHLARDGEGMSLATQSHLAQEGMYFERCLIATYPDLRDHLRSDAPPEARDVFDGDEIWTRLLAGIEATGPARNVLATDLGQASNQLPPVGLATYHQNLLDSGFTRDELETMARENPDELFGAE